MRKIAIAGAILLLAFQFIFQLYLAKSDSQTTDEGVHLSAGYTYLTKRDYRFNPEHPVLIKIIAALPLLFIKPAVPDDGIFWDNSSDFFYDSWVENRAFGEQMLYGLGNDAQKLIFWGRLPMVVLTVLLGLAIFLVSTKLWGWSGGFLSLALFTFDPNFTAHGHLIATDIAVSLGFLLTIFVFWKFLNSPTWLNALFVGFALGYSQLVKFTAVIIYPVLLGLIIYYLIENRIKIWKDIRPYLKIFASLAICWLMIWSAYSFDLSIAPKSNAIVKELKEINNLNSPTLLPNYENLNPDALSQEQIESKTAKLGIADKIYTYARYFLVPRDYFKGLVMVITHVGGGHSSFFLGQNSNQGWWYYFPVLFMAKTSIFSLILFTLAGYIFIITKKRTPETKFFALACLVFLIIAMTSKANLGLRHIFPIYPLLFIISGGLILSSKKIKSLAALATFGLIVEFFFIFPYYISYYNRLVGGTANGYKIATDSNYDWGQDLKKIKAYIDSHTLKPLWVEYGWDGPSSLEYYKINSMPLQILNEDSKGYLIIGASGRNNIKYNWLKNYQPIDRITPSVFVYKIGDL